MKDASGFVKAFEDLSLTLSICSSQLESNLRIRDEMAALGDHLMIAAGATPEQRRCIA